MNTTVSDNLSRLRILTDKITSEEENGYALIVKKLKNIVESGKEEIENSNSPQIKIRCYELMCSSITNLLSNVKVL